MPPEAKTFWESFLYYADLKGEIDCQFVKKKVGNNKLNWST